MKTLAQIRDEIAQRPAQERPAQERPAQMTYEQWRVWEVLQRNNPTSPTINPRYSPTRVNCPHCDDDYTHHLFTEIFNRHEDSETGEHILISTPESLGSEFSPFVIPENMVDCDLSQNPSERRTGIKITFICESCWSLFAFKFAQHKGTTIVEVK